MNLQAVLRKLLGEYLGTAAVKVVCGELPVAKAVVANIASFDMVFYTGGPVVGSIIAQEAAKNLIPVRAAEALCNRCIFEPMCSRRS
eukprot:SAG31_NODE_139_length_22847_cov_8.142474_7_plen_87_part_00